MRARAAGKLPPPFETPLDGEHPVSLSFLGPLIASAMGARPKRHHRALGFLAGSRGSLLSAGNLMALGGLGWAAYEVFRTRNAGGSAASGPVVTPGTVVEGDLPPPLPPEARASAASGAPTSPEIEVRRVVELTLAAARSDGELGEDEYGAILRTARDLGAEAMVRAALERPRALGEIVAGVVDPAQRDALYVYAFAIVRADEEVRPAERAWLEQLAAHLRLDRAAVAKLEKETAYRIASMPPIPSGPAGPGTTRA